MLVKTSKVTALDLALLPWTYIYSKSGEWSALKSGLVSLLFCTEAKSASEEWIAFYFFHSGYNSLGFFGRNKTACQRAENRTVGDNRVHTWITRDFSLSRSLTMDITAAVNSQCEREIQPAKISTPLIFIFHCPVAWNCELLSAKFSFIASLTLKQPLYVPKIRRFWDDADRQKWKSAKSF